MGRRMLKAEMAWCGDVEKGSGVGRRRVQQSQVYGVESQLGREGGGAVWPLNDLNGPERRLGH
jgi:hypothetical protein